MIFILILLIIYVASIIGVIYAWARKGSKFMEQFFEYQFGVWPFIVTNGLLAYILYCILIY